jgi:hypothetical protein
MILRRLFFFFFNIFVFVGTGSVERGSTFPIPTVFAGVAAQSPQHPHSCKYLVNDFIYYYNIIIKTKEGS